MAACSTRAGERRLVVDDGQAGDHDDGLSLRRLRKLRDGGGGQEGRHQGGQKSYRFRVLSDLCDRRRCPWGSAPTASPPPSLTDSLEDWRNPSFEARGRRPARPLGELCQQMPGCITASHSKRQAWRRSSAVRKFATNFCITQRPGLVIGRLQRWRAARDRDPVPVRYEEPSRHTEG